MFHGQFEYQNFRLHTTYKMNRIKTQFRTYTLSSDHKTLTKYESDVN